MKYGVDYASSQEGKIGAFKAAGRDFICRYVSTPGNPKNLTAAEVAACAAHKVEIVTVFEQTANRALAGFAAGAADAKAAEAQLPFHMQGKAVVYFAVDFDATLHDQVSINDYLRGAVSVLGKARTGVYGGYWVVKRALDAKVVRYAWQTYAWSGGQWDARAQIRQYQNAQTLAGVSVDFDSATTHDYGQWPRPVVQRIPTKAQLRKRILAWRKKGVSWRKIKTFRVWKLWRAKGGK